MELETFGGDEVCSIILPFQERIVPNMVPLVSAPFLLIFHQVLLFDLFHRLTNYSLLCRMLGVKDADFLGMLISTQSYLHSLLVFLLKKCFLVSTLTVLWFRTKTRSQRVDMLLHHMLSGELDKPQTSGP